DVMKILGLALAFGDVRGDPDVLAKLWNVKDPLAAFEDLARRYDFVLPVSRRLHDDVRDTLRIDLLDPWRRSRARDINERVLALFRTRLREMRARWFTLDEQLAHPRFSTAVLCVLWHTLWVDNQAGLDLFIEILPVLAVADPPTADAAAALVDNFAGTFDEDQRNDLDLLTSLREASAGMRISLGGVLRQQLQVVRRARRVEITAPGLALRPAGQAPGEPLIGERADRETAVMILRAHLQAGNQDQQDAVTSLQAAGAQTTSA